MTPPLARALPGALLARGRTGAQRRLMGLRSHPRLWKPEAAVQNPNALFSKRQVDRLWGHTQRVAHRDERLLARLSERRIEGLRAWEYGMLLGHLLEFPERSGWAALDVGSGNSAFPDYLLSTANVGSMTTLDLPEAFEGREVRSAPDDSAALPRHVDGSMLDIPFPEATFELVTCISAIEHLDGNPAAHRRDPERNPMLEYDEYRDHTRTALGEMCRVLKPGGRLYLTTDAYIPELQQTDGWAKQAGGPIRSAYRFADVSEVFVDTVDGNGLELVGPSAYGEELLRQSDDHSTYRGRYFTTFALCARRRTARARS